VVQPVYREPFTVAVPVGHPLADQEAIEPDQLAEHDLLLLGQGHCFGTRCLVSARAVTTAGRSGACSARWRAAHWKRCA